MVTSLKRFLRLTLTCCSIWNWQQSVRLNRFSNGNPPGSKINEARFINEDDQALLMTGSSDGVIKIFRNYESDKQVEMVSAFRALTDIVPSNKNSGLVFDWQQGQGKLLVAGDVKVVRVWNAATEICTNVGIPYPSQASCANPNRIFPRGQGLALHRLPRTKLLATFLSADTEMARYVSLISALSLPWPWSRFGGSINSGLPMSICSEVVYESWSAEAATERSSCGTSVEMPPFVP